ncbi:MAG TPA: hypothetical protein VG937_02290 [Polyangiaceae bacterium]|nr:hypothetical protein [Polyangiaceae bacterium]
MFARLAALIFATAACRSEARVVEPLEPRTKVTKAPASASAQPATARAPSDAAPAPAPARSAPAPARSAPAPERAARRWPPAANGATSDFCIEGVDALDEASCYVLPDAPATELLIYLHGIVPPSKVSRQKTNFQTVVGRASRRAGIAALLPRGRQGLAPKGHDGWWSWPTSGESYRDHARELIAELATRRQKLEALTGARFTRVYVGGSSAGAYFVVALALSGDLRADGFAAIAGGAIRRGRDLSQLERAPFYVGYGTHDTVSESSRSLAEQLRHAGWPVLLAVHPLPHGAAEVYLDEAFAFFRAQAAGG